MKRIFLAALLLFPAQAWASGCDCGAIQGMITMAKMETIQSVNANTTAEAASIRSEILMAAQNIIGTIKSESATIVRAIISLKENNAAMIKGQATAQEATKTEDLYGKAAQPAGLCPWSRMRRKKRLPARPMRPPPKSMRGGSMRPLKA